jgi:hypothetical protein
LGVGLGFLDVSGALLNPIKEPVGLSLWRPDLLDWLHEDAVGPSEYSLPSEFWICGLGHLGQAYAWTVSLFNYIKERPKIVLIDYDQVEPENFETGLLTFKDQKGYKTRIVNEWLEARDITTQIIERKFTPYILEDKDPDTLLGGTDSVTCRQTYPTDRLFIIDCGLGGTSTDFDKMTVLNLRKFEKQPKDIWTGSEGGEVGNTAMKALLEVATGCGQDESGIATTFVGAMSSCLVISEAIRKVNKGMICKKVTLSLRNIANRIVISGGDYTVQDLGNRPSIKVI